MNNIPNSKSYNFMIKTCAKCRKINEAEKYFQEAISSIIFSLMNQKKIYFRIWK